MAKIAFEWNPAKARANLKKHGVAFEEAATVFFDDRVRYYEKRIRSYKDEIST